jgi:hypothetical protein
MENIRLVRPCSRWKDTIKDDVEVVGYEDRRWTGVQGRAVMNLGLWYGSISCSTSVRDHASKRNFLLHQKQTCTFRDEISRVYIMYLYCNVAARSKACVCHRSLAGIACSNQHRGHGCLSLVSVVYVFR